MCLQQWRNRWLPVCTVTGDYQHTLISNYVELICCVNQEYCVWAEHTIWWNIIQSSVKFTRSKSLVHKKQACHIEYLSFVTLLLGRWTNVCLCQIETRWHPKGSISSKSNLVNQFRLLIAVWVRGHFWEQKWLKDNSPKLHPNMCGSSWNLESWRSLTTYWQLNGSESAFSKHLSLSELLPGGVASLTMPLGCPYCLHKFGEERRDLVNLFSFKGFQNFGVVYFLCLMSSLQEECFPSA